MLNRNEATMLKYKNYRKILTQLKLSIKRTFYSDLFKKVQKEHKTLWSILNSLIKRNNNKEETIEVVC